MHLTSRSRALILLTIQNAAIVLLTRATRIGQESNLYTVSTAVFVAEILKAVISCLIAATEYRNAAIRKKEGSDAPGLPECVVWTIRDAFTTRRNDFVKLLVPAVLYAGQNNLLYVALSNLPAAVYQTTYQLKILTTAIFSIVFLQRRYSVAKWLSLLLLTIGVCIVQIPTSSKAQPNTKVHSHGEQNRMKGFLAVMTACISSGLAGAYFEGILKPSQPSKSGSPSSSLAMRNLQLALLSAPFSLAAILLPQYDRERVYRLGFFHGYTFLVQFVILNQALGGLLIAAVVKEADSVSKGFATSLAVILSTAVTSIASRQLPSLQLNVGGGLVILATCMFAVVR